MEVYQYGKEKIKASEANYILGRKIKYWIALSLCAAVLVAGIKRFIALSTIGAGS